MFAQVYTVVFLAVFAQSAFAATCSRTYAVVEGDYCDKISQAQNVSTYQLAAINPTLINKGCSNLIPGQSLCLGFSGEDCSTTHIVQAGDTCADIAAQNALNMTILHLNNPQLDDVCDIYVGQVLCTSKTVQVPAIPSSGIAVSMGGSTPVSTIVPLASTPSSNPGAVVAAPSPTPTPSPAPSPSNGNNDNNDGNDDENLPFCDEL